jgi:hypothetical protein
MQSGFTESPFETSGQAYGSQSWGQSSQGRHYGGREMSAGEAALEFLRDYSRERPEVVALWAFGIGFILGWKLKPW